MIIQSDCFQTRNTTGNCTEYPFYLNQTFAINESSSFQNYTPGNNGSNQYFTAGFYY